MLSNIDIDRIRTKKKKEEPLLPLADLTAHSLYKLVDKSKRYYSITEPRYVRELSTKFFGDPTNLKVNGAGIYCVHSISDLQIDPECENILDSMISNLHRK